MSPLVSVDLGCIFLIFFVPFTVLCSICEADTIVCSEVENGRLIPQAEFYIITESIHGLPFRKKIRGVNVSWTCRERARSWRTFYNLCWLFVEPEFPVMPQGDSGLHSPHCFSCLSLHCPQITHSEASPASAPGACSPLCGQGQ